MNDIVLVTGGFDPVHSGHIACFQEAKNLGGHLIVGLNSDAWLTRKKGRPFMPWTERAAVIRNLTMVDDVISFNDDDNSSTDAIRHVLKTAPANSRIVFANGGDRTDKNIPEMIIDDPRVKFVFGIGGFNKSNSSSWILEEWKAPKTPRTWGYYRVLHEAPGVKVKELTVNPGDALSMQRHQDRSEFWLVAEGEATVYTLDRSTDVEFQGRYKRHEYLHISTNDWHQLINEDPNPLKIIEIQYGDRCEEDDIERKFYEIHTNFHRV